MKKNILTILLMLAGAAAACAIPGYAIIKGKVNILSNGDLAYFHVSRYFDSPYPGLDKTYICRISNHSFRFKVRTDSHPDSFSLRFMGDNKTDDQINRYRNLNINYGLIVDNDHINISSKNGSLKYSGGGCEKLRILAYFNSVSDVYYKRYPIAETAFVKKYFEGRDSVTLLQLRILNLKKEHLKPSEFCLLKSVALSAYYSKFGILRFRSGKDAQQILINLMDYDQNPSAYVKDLDIFNNNAILQYADLYASSIFDKYMFDSCYSVKKRLDARSCYLYLMSNYRGKLRERLITNLLADYRKADDDNALLIDNALKYITNTNFRKILQQIRAGQVKGAIAYNFKLTDTSGKVHSLSDYRGKVVLIDFWFTGCGNCKELEPYLSTIEEDFKNERVVFLSVNIDKKKKQWINSVSSHLYSSEYTIDLFTNGEGMSHPLCKYYSVEGAPALILIDKIGKLSNNPVDPRIDAGKDLRNLINNELNK